MTLLNMKNNQIHKIRSKILELKEMIEQLLFKNI